MVGRTWSATKTKGPPTAMSTQWEKKKQHLGRKNDGRRATAMKTVRWGNVKKTCEGTFKHRTGVLASPAAARKKKPLKKTRYQWQSKKKVWEKKIKRAASNVPLKKKKKGKTITWTKCGEGETSLPER